MRRSICAAALLLVPVAGFAQPAGAREAFLKVCGGCHPVETVTSQRRTRAQWQESINSMVTRGAKGTDAELAAILDYLAAQFGPAAPGAPAAPPFGPAAEAGDGTRRICPGPPTSTWWTRPLPIAAVRSTPPSASTATARMRAVPTTAPT